MQTASPAGQKPGPTAGGGFSEGGHTHTQTRVGPAALGRPCSRKATAGYGKGSGPRCADSGPVPAPRCLPCPASRERPSVGMERPRRWGSRWLRHREHPRARRTGSTPDTESPGHREHSQPLFPASTPLAPGASDSPAHSEHPPGTGSIRAPLPRLPSRAPAASRSPLPAADRTYRPEVRRRREVSPKAGPGGTGQSRQRPPPAAAPARLRPAQAERGPAAAAAPGTCPPPPLAAPGAAGGRQPGGRGASTLPPERGHRRRGRRSRSDRGAASPPARCPAPHPPAPRRGHGAPAAALRAGPGPRSARRCRRAARPPRSERRPPAPLP
ncbi:nascent polypeptide-associated complex subunit alpha, muscle-specific form-like [Lathamus discolor]|uniref:nascent polypeptide-associated complex subunit alpha, muscle-specific form-like n=1 Tax=Lathamus discolor TaxID=678569 RepID=UPI0032B76CA7